MTPSTAILIPVNSIDLIDGLMYREINKGHIESLVAADEPDKWPAIIVTPYQEGYGLIAGQHRIGAAMLLKRSTILATVIEFTTIEKLSIVMWEDNSKHGIAYTVKERKEQAVNLSRAYPSMTLREIGRRTGLPHQTVKSAIDATKKTSTGNQEYDGYAAQQMNYAKRLKTALVTFFAYENKRYIRRGGTSPKDMQHRAVLLAQNFKGEQDAPQMLESLAESLLAAADMLQSQKKKGA